MDPQKKSLSTSPQASNGWRVSPCHFTKDETLTNCNPGECSMILKKKTHKNKQQHIEVPSREPTYPTLGKGNKSGIC